MITLIEVCGCYCYSLLRMELIKKWLMFRTENEKKMITDRQNAYKNNRRPCGTLSSIFVNGSICKILQPV